jgi:quercetin dioxygenase-like cupin family protein
MPDTKILDTLVTNNRILDVVAKRLDAISRLFSGSPIDKIMPTVDGFVYSDTVRAVTIYQTDDITATVGEWALQGDVWPDHEHTDSLEYLIIISGMFMLKLEGVPRIMEKGDCASIPPGLKHSVTALCDGSSILGVCIPPEKAYLVENIKWPTSQEKS